MNVVRIGTGAGFSGDRLEPAVDLAKHGNLDYLVFECLAERTIALAQLKKMRDSNKGFDPHLEIRMQTVLQSCARNGTKIITNMGAANPVAAAKHTAMVASKLGLHGLKTAAVAGDEVMAHIGESILTETGKPVKDLGSRLVSANAYMGIEGLLEALANNAEVIVCGRVSDTSLFLAPLVHNFGWSKDDYIKLGRGTLVGHLMECGGQICGGYFAEPGKKEVPDLAHIGFPIAEVRENGDALVTKLKGTGGVISKATCTEQLLYEIHDPSRYIQPDVIADFSNVQFEELEKDCILISNGSGFAPTGNAKVSVGFMDGWIGEGQISYVGLNCVERGRLAIELVRDRLKKMNDIEILEEQCNLIGYDSIYPKSASKDLPNEVRMRYATKCPTKEMAETVAFEVESLYLNGPAGGGGVSSSVREILGIASTFVPLSKITANVEYFEA